MTKLLKKQCENLNFAGIEFPMKSKDIDKFEKQHPEISVNVLGYENKKIYPLRISKLNRKTACNLLLLEHKHYCLIKNFVKTFVMQNFKKYKKKFFCLKRD